MLGFILIIKQPKTFPIGLISLAPDFKDIFFFSKENYGGMNLLPLGYYYSFSPQNCFVRIV